MVTQDSKPHAIYNQVGAQFASQSSDSRSGKGQSLNDKLATSSPGNWWIWITTCLTLTMILLWHARYRIRMHQCCGCSQQKCQRRECRHVTYAHCMRQHIEGVCLQQLDTPPILSSAWNCPQRHHLTIGFGVALPWSSNSVTENWQQVSARLALLVFSLSSPI
jgi:hypothetical protein